MIRLYQPTDLEFAKEVFAHSEGAFEGWTELPDFTRFLTYVIEGKGMGVLEALGGGEYLASSCFLPHARGPITGKYQALAIGKAFLETDAIAIWGTGDVSNPNGINNLRFFGEDSFVVDEHRKANKLDFIRWALTDKFFEREVNQWPVDIPHKKMLYAVLKCAENGWGMKGFRQWYLYERLSKNVPNIVPLNVEFTLILCGDTILSLNAEMPSVKINL
jgi:hypothetical protein